MDTSPSKNCRGFRKFQLIDNTYSWGRLRPLLCPHFLTELRAELTDQPELATEVRYFSTVLKNSDQKLCTFHLAKKWQLVRGSTEHTYRKAVVLRDVKDLAFRCWATEEARRTVVVQRLEDEANLLEESARYRESLVGFGGVEQTQGAS